MSQPSPSTDFIPHFAALAGVAVLLIFGGFELLERVWFGNSLGPEALRWLLLARGLLATAAVGVLATVLVLRRPPSPFPVRETPGESELAAGRHRVEWFIRLRWLAVLGVAGASYIATKATGLLAPSAFLPLLLCLGLLIAANVMHGFLAQRRHDWERQLRLQMALDVVLLTALLHYSGGLENPFHPIYVFHVIIAAILFGPSSARHFALGSWSLFCAVSLAEAAGWLVGPECLWAPRVASPGLALIRLVPLLGVLLLTAYLTSVIMEQLRRRERQWVEAAGTAAEARAKLESVVRAAGLALMVLDAEMKIVWSNDRAREWFGEDGAGKGKGCLICKTGDGADCFS